MEPCRICGCDEENPCDGGCFWVFTDLCSRCAFEAIAEQAANFDEAARFEIAEQLVALADRIHPENDANVAAAEEAFYEQLEDGPLRPRIWRPGDPT